jgi:5S rRNA maturation endonuclease (ribonuclease M5)
MSAIFKTHTSIVYESKGKNKTIAPLGNRLVITKAMPDKDGNFGPHLQQTMATAVPVLQLTDADFANTELRDAVSAYFLEVQHKVIGQRIRDDGQKTHIDSDIDVSACLRYLAAEASGDKWDATRIAEWFAATIGDALGVKLLEVNPTLDNTGLEKLLLANTDLFVKCMTKRATSITVKQAQTCVNRLRLIDESKWDRAARKFYARMDAIINPPEVSEVIEENLGLD